MSDQWLRLYENVVHDPKLQRLPGDIFKGLINIWCIASVNGGRLPPIEDIAFALRMSVAKAQDLINTLAAAGLIDDTEDGRMPHNWTGRQFKNDVSTARVKRHRERKQAVAGNGMKPFHETPPEQSRADTDTDKMRNAVSCETAHTNLEKQLFDRGKEVCGRDAGGLITKILKAKGGDVALARAAIETASTKQNPREYLGAIIHNKDPPERRDTDGIL